MIYFNRSGQLFANMLGSTALFLLISGSFLHAQTFLFSVSTSMERGDTLTLDIIYKDAPQNLSGGELHMKLDLSQFEFLTIESDVDAIQEGDLLDNISFVDGTDMDLGELHFEWRTSNLATGDSVHTDDILIRIRLQATNSIANVNDFIYIDDGRSNFFTYYDQAQQTDVVAETSSTASIQVGDGTVSITYIMEDQFGFHASKSSRLTYIIAQTDGRILGRYESHVHAGENVLRFPQDLFSKSTQGTFVLAISDGSHTYSKLFYMF